MQFIRTIIIEDELDAQNLLSRILRDYSPEIELVGIESDIKGAKKIIEEQIPDLVFLDIELENGNSFELLDQLKIRNFKIVFITAYEEYALKAFKYEAVDYILKPFTPKDVIKAITRVKQRKYDETIYNRLDYLIKQNSSEKKSKIKIPTAEGISFVNIDDIVRVEADRSYCHIYFLSNTQRIMVSKPLKDLEEMLPKDDFFRSHMSHLINTNYVDEYVNEDGGYILMTDKSMVPLARRRRQEFLEKVG